MIQAMTREPADQLQRDSDSARFPGLLMGFAHLTVLSAFALAQPLFDLFSKNAEFFAVRRSSPLEIVGFALAVTFLPPVGMLVVEVLTGLASPILRRALHLVFVAGLSGLIAIQLVKRAGDHSSALVIALAAASGIAVALLYLRAPPARSFLTILSPAPLIFLALFLLASPVEKLVLPADVNAAITDVSARAPVVLIVFDEFSEYSLMNRAHKLDADRFPNFARLARNSTWFRNATTVSHSTTKAVPAIMTGIRPRPDKLPIFADHRDNIFTLLGGSYRMNVVESQTSLCPQQLCGDDRPRLSSTGTQPKEASLYSDASYVYLHLIAPPRLEDRLPSISTAWENFGTEGGTEASADYTAIDSGRTPQERGEFWDDRDQAFRAFVASIRATTQPSLNFAHVLLPHGPYRYLPSGRQYAIGNRALGRDGDSWGPRTALVVQAYERYLYQLQFTDRLLGRLLARLKSIGLYDQALIVVTADHGISIRPGDRRREPTRTNIQDVAYVPLFVKRPAQREGTISDAHVETVDILPTIADALGISVPWRTDGRSGFGDVHTGRVNVSGFVRPVDTVLQAREAALRRQIRLFGTGTTRPVLYGVGPYPSILGRPVSRYTVVGAGSASAVIDARPLALLRSLPRGSRFYPALVTGVVSGLGAGRPVAVAVNGLVAGTSTTITFLGAIHFSVLVPETLLHPGHNPVRVYGLSGSGSGISLSQLAAG